VVVIVYEIPSLMSAVLATIGHELSMLDQMFVMPDQVLLMPRSVFAVLRWIFSIPELVFAMLFTSLAASPVHFADVCSVIDISRAGFANGCRNVANTESNLAIAR